MAQPPKSGSKLVAHQQRQARLAAELRANLHKRKEVLRSRAAQDARKSMPQIQESEAGGSRAAAQNPPDAEPGSRGGAG